MFETKSKERKGKFLSKIMGELEAYLETPAEEWVIEQEDALIDMMDALEHAIKAKLPV